MSRPSKDQAVSFELITQPARQRLRGRISDAGGNISTVRSEVARALAALDQESSAAATPTSCQAQRAFHVAQLTYLDHLAQSERTSEPVRHLSLWSRLSRSNGRT